MNVVVKAIDIGFIVSPLVSLKKMWRMIEQCFLGMDFMLTSADVKFVLTNGILSLQAV